MFYHDQACVKWSFAARPGTLSNFPLTVSILSHNVMNSVWHDPLRSLKIDSLFSGLESVQ